MDYIIREDNITLARICHGRCHWALNEIQAFVVSQPFRNQLSSLPPIQIEKCNKTKHRKTRHKSQRSDHSWRRYSLSRIMMSAILKNLLDGEKGLYWTV